jgi:hypothetical protein
LPVFGQIDSKNTYGEKCVKAVFLNCDLSFFIFAAHQPFYSRCSINTLWKLIERFLIRSSKGRILSGAFSLSLSDLLQYKGLYYARGKP